MFDVIKKTFIRVSPHGVTQGLANFQAVFHLAYVYS